MQTDLRKDRIEIIDILRGFALLGIIIVHFTEQYYAGQPPEVHADMITRSLGDKILMGFIGILVQGKFYMIFSFLFGLSFLIQLNKSDRSGRFALRFSWRLIVLFLIGLLHHLHYRGDILTIYAVLGFALLLSYRLPDRVLLILSFLLIINIPSVVVRLYDAFTGTSSTPNADQTALLKYFDTMKSGNYLSILQANWYELIPKFKFQVSFGRIYITTGLFLLGLLVGRKKFFEHWQEQMPVIKRLMKTSLWTLLGCILFSLAFFGGAQAMKIEMNPSFQFAIGGLLFDIFNACVATLYTTGILQLYREEKWQRRLMAFYFPGRMGLTTYLTQSFFGVLIFFSIGLGLLGDYGASVWVGVGLVVFVFQVYFSQWWLSRFRYGFFEWLWRSATYFKWQEFKK
jgi:uncharacterized protein